MDIKAVLKAVDNAKWQEFRESLKGLSTKEKLTKLRAYLKENGSKNAVIRADNYVKALARGGLVTLGEEFKRDLSHVRIIK